MTPLESRLLHQLKKALRYAEVNVAYQGAMTAAEVEAAILANKHVTSVQTCANSVCILAEFNFKEVREVIAEAEVS